MNGCAKCSFKYVGVVLFVVFCHNVWIVWPVATIVGFDHCNCLIPILLWHLCIQELARIESPWYWAILCSMLLLLLYCVLSLTQAKKCNAEYVYRLKHFDTIGLMGQSYGIKIIYWNFTLVNVMAVINVMLL